MATTLTKFFRIDGVLTDMTSVKLSSSDGTYGVKRNDTDAVVVADGVEMTRVSVGRYSYSFDDPAYDLTYTVAYEVAYGGETYRVEQTVSGAATPDSTETESATDVETDLGDTIAANAAGPAEAEQDGTRIKQHSLKDQIAADRYLAEKAAQTSRRTGMRFFKGVPPGAV